jgi:hypothetical protein
MLFQCLTNSNFYLETVVFWSEQYVATVSTVFFLPAGASPVKTWDKISGLPNPEQS